MIFSDGGAGSLGDACRSKAESLFYPNPWKKEVSAAAARTGVSESMILSVMRQESKFRKNAVSRSGAQGLMQIMPTTAKDESRSLKMETTGSDIKDPGNNILLGASYFARLSRIFSGELPRAIAAYNAGMMPVTRWNTLYADDWVEWIERSLTRKRGNMSGRYLKTMRCIRCYPVKRAVYIRFDVRGPNARGEAGIRAGT